MCALVTNELRRAAKTETEHTSGNLCYLTPPREINMTKYIGAGVCAPACDWFAVQG